MSTIERRIAMLVLRWRMNALAARINWSVDHIASHKREIKALNDDIEFRERLIEKCEREWSVLRSKAWGLEAPRGLIKS